MSTTLMARQMAQPVARGSGTAPNRARTRRGVLSVAGSVLAALAIDATALAHVPHDDVSALAVAPEVDGEPMVLAVVRGCLFRSDDGGYAWRRITEGIEGPVWGSALAISPGFASDRTVFLTMGASVLRSTDGAASFATQGAPSGSDLKLIELSPNFARDGAVVVADAQGALYRSVDRGGVWDRIDAAFEVSACVWDGARLLVGTTAGEVLESMDQGDDWDTVARDPGGESITALLGAGGGGTLFFGTASGAVHALHEGRLRSDPAQLKGGRVMSLARVGERLLSTTWGEAVFVSDDGGQSWEPSRKRLFTSRQADEFERPHFSTVTSTDAGTVFLASFCGIFRSETAGDSWFKLETTFDHVVALDVVHGEDGGLQLAVSTYGSGAYVSSDLGVTWDVRNTGLHHPRLGPIAMSSDFARDGTIFAGVFGQLYRSTNRGVRWERRKCATRRSLVGVRTRMERWSRSRCDFIGGLMRRAGPVYEPDYLPPTPIAFGVSPDFGVDRTVFAGMHPNGLLRSTDGGESYDLIWGSNQERARAVVLSPDFARDDTLFVAAGERLWRSTDRGASWTPLGGDLRLEAPVLAVSPSFGQDRVVLAGGSGGLWLSRDAGTSWEAAAEGSEMRGLSGLAVSPDFARDRTILVQALAGDLLLGRVAEDRVTWSRTGLSRDGRAASPIVRREGAHLLKFSPNYAVDRTLLAVSLYTLMVSTDAGATWIERPRPIRYDVGITMDDWFYMPVYFDGVWEKTGPVEHDETVGPSSVGVISSQKGARLTFTFTGRSVRWIGARDAGLGIATVSLDGELVEDVDQYAPAPEFGVPLFVAMDLAPGPHEITIEVSGRRNPHASGLAVDVNAFEVTREAR